MAEPAGLCLDDGAGKPAIDAERCQKGTRAALHGSLLLYGFMGLVLLPFISSFPLPH